MLKVKQTPYHEYLFVLLKNIYFYQLKHRNRNSIGPYFAKNVVKMPTLSLLIDSSTLNLQVSFCHRVSAKSHKSPQVV